VRRGGNALRLKDGSLRDQARQRQDVSAQSREHSLGAAAGIAAAGIAGRWRCWRWQRQQQRRSQSQGGTATDSSRQHQQQRGRWQWWAEVGEIVTVLVGDDVSNPNEPQRPDCCFRRCFGLQRHGGRRQRGKGEQREGVCLEILVWRQRAEKSSGDTTAAAAATKHSARRRAAAAARATARGGAGGRGGGGLGAESAAVVVARPTHGQASPHPPPDSVSFGVLKAVVDLVHVFKLPQRTFPTQKPFVWRRRERG